MGTSISVGKEPLTIRAESIDELQRLERVENEEADRISAARDPLLAGVFRVAAAATLTCDKAREEVAASRSWPWWRRASARNASRVLTHPNRNRALAGAYRRPQPSGRWPEWRPVDCTVDRTC